MANSAWTEPESAANVDKQPIYPYNNVTETESGHSFEMDDTPGRERVRISHRSGTFIEMHPDGSEVHKVYGNGYEITIQDKNILIQGKCNITVQGDSVLNIQGDSYTQVGGNSYQQIKGQVQQLIQGNVEQTIQGNYNINASGDINVSATNLNVNADLNVRGDIAGTQSIGAVGNISAGASVSATKSVETTGYVVAGTTITAGVSVFGPEVSDMFSSMEMFRLKVDQHVHIGNKGFPTSPPTTIMEQ